MKRVLIVFEGIDKSGKTTQSRLLAEALTKKGIVNEYWKYPKRETPIGSILDAHLKKTRILNDKVAHLLFSANRWETVDEMKEKLENGCTIIVDRYMYSGAAYSNHASAIYDRGLPTPNLVFYLDISPEEAQKRAGIEDEYYETMYHQELAYNEFCKMRRHFIPLEATCSVDVLHEAILEKTLELFQ